MELEREFVTNLTDTYARILKVNLSWESNLSEILPVNCKFIVILS